MIRDLKLFPLDRCCYDWSESLRRNTIELTIDGYCLAGTEKHISTCPYCGGDKRGRVVSITSLTS
jgi:hypothetical protein